MRPPPNLDRLRYMLSGLLMKLRGGAWLPYEPRALHEERMLQRLAETERRAWHAEADLGMERIANRELRREVQQLRETLRNQDLMEEG